MHDSIRDYLNHHQASEVGIPMFLIIDALQKIEDKRQRIPALGHTLLMALDATVGIDAGLTALLNALKDYKAQETDHFKAGRDYVAQEIAK